MIEEEEEIDGEKGKKKKEMDEMGLLCYVEKPAGSEKEYNYVWKRARPVSFIMMDPDSLAAVWVDTDCYSID